MAWGWGVVAKLEKIIWIFGLCFPAQQLIIQPIQPILSILVGYLVFLIAPDLIFLSFPGWPLKVYQWLPRRALAAQLVARSVPEHEFWCPWEPLGLILGAPGVLFGRI